MLFFKIVVKHAPLVKIRAKKDKAESTVNEVSQLLPKEVQKNSISGALEQVQRTEGRS